MKKFFILLLLFATPGFAKTVSLAWDAPPVSDLAGYKIYRAATSGGYTKDVNGKLTSPLASVASTFLIFSDTAAPAAGTLFYVVTAFNTSGTESGPSNEVQVLNTVAPNPPSNLRISGVIIP